MSSYLKKEKENETTTQRICTYYNVTHTHIIQNIFLGVECSLAVALSSLPSVKKKGEKDI